jgi:hypothetical protein
MKNEEKTQIKTSGSPDAVHSVDESRRSFSKKGLIAPVIMTLANRSAWGANACVGSGFQSYSAAVKNGQTLSHAAPNPDGSSPYADWKTPAEWGEDSDSARSSWPYRLNRTPRVVPVRTNPSNSSRFQRWGNTQNGLTWTGNLTLSNARTNWDKAFLDQLLGSGYSTTMTIYQQLQSNTSDLLAYQIATAMNLLIYPVSVPTPNFTVFTLEEFVLFYNNCL